MDITLFIFAIILLVLGIAGAFLPVLPGPPLSWLGLLVASFSNHSPISNFVLIITLVIAILITALDYLLPALMTKKTGGSKIASRASLIGLLIGIIVGGPLGVILGPFCGAFFGEFYHNKDAQKSLHVAWGTLIGFICGTGLKLICALAFVWIFISVAFF